MLHNDPHHRGIRLSIRRNIGFGMDDLHIIPAFLTYAALVGIGFFGGLSTGIGFHVYDLVIIDVNLRYCASIYIPSFGFYPCRTSILWLYLRLTVSGIHSTAQRYIIIVLVACYIFMIISFLYSSSNAILYLQQ